MFISVFNEHGIEQVSFSIDSAIEVTPFATYLDVCLVQIPGMTSNSTPFSAQVLANQRGEPEPPNPDRFVTDLETSLQQKFSNITKSELVSQAPKNGE
jgi:hypothetical protein